MLVDTIDFEDLCSFFRSFVSNFGEITLYIVSVLFPTSSARENAVIMVMTGDNLIVKTMAYTTGTLVRYQDDRRCLTTSRRGCSHEAASTYMHE